MGKDIPSEEFTSAFVLPLQPIKYNPKAKGQQQRLERGFPSLMSVP